MQDKKISFNLKVSHAEYRFILAVPRFKLFRSSKKSSESNQHVHLMNIILSANLLFIMYFLLIEYILDHQATIGTITIHTRSRSYFISSSSF